MPALAATGLYSARTSPAGRRVGSDSRMVLTDYYFFLRRFLLSRRFLEPIFLLRLDFPM